MGNKNKASGINTLHRLWDVNINALMEMINHRNIQQSILIADNIHHCNGKYIWAHNVNAAGWRPYKNVWKVLDDGLKQINQRTADGTFDKAKYEKHLNNKEWEDKAVYLPPDGQVVILKKGKKS